MKKFVLSALLLALLVVPATAQSSLDRETLNSISESVVFILALKDGQPVSSGSGTVVTADGLIFTNRHVVEDADDFEIYFLEDSNELPVHRYNASPTMVFNEMDFATLQIDRRADGSAVLRPALNLPFLDTSTPAEAERGDQLFVLGYPGTADGYFALTSGTVSTIRNGDIGDQRLPVWYQTDAEISPGNSGGLAVNAEGVPVGIPTAVRVDTQTAGRLGGVLPYSTVYALIESGTGIMVTGGRVPSTDSSGSASSGDGGSLFIEVSDVEFGVELDANSGPGVLITTRMLAEGLAGIPLRVGLFFYWTDTGDPIMAQTEDFSTPSGAITAQDVLTPQGNSENFDGLQFWLPYTTFPFDFDGEREAVIIADVGIDGDQFIAPSEEWSFVITGVGSGGGTTTAAAGGTFPGAYALCRNGLEITNGFEITITQMRPGFEYTATVLGINNFDPILAVQSTGSSGDALCSDDDNSAATYSVRLPTTGNVGSSTFNSQVRFTNTTSGFLDVSFIVGGYNGAPGEFVLILEGMAATPADGLGDPFTLNLTPNITNSGGLAAVYMIGTERQLDPLMYILGDGGQPLTDSSGVPYLCDDGGNPNACWGESYSLEGSAVVRQGATYAGDASDAMLLLTMSPQEQTLPVTYIMTSYQQSSTGRYLLAFHVTIG